MLSSVLALLLAGAASDVGAARATFAGCIKNFVRSSLDQKMEPAAFDTAVDGACKAEEASFKAAITSDNMGFGMKRPAAEADAADQANEYRMTARDNYPGWFESGTKP